MSSVSPHIKTIPSEGAYYINLASLSGKIMNFNPNGGSTPAFSTATWADTANAAGPAGATGGQGISTALNTAGRAILRDCGKTVVSSLRTFRKVQLIVSSISNGVSVGAPVSHNLGGTANPVVGEEYFTGYIEVLGANGALYGAGGVGSTNIAPVARLG